MIKLVPTLLFVFNFFLLLIILKCLEQGEIDIIINGSLKRTISVGNGFGELALLSNQLRLF